MQSLGDIFISSCNKVTKKRGLLSFVEGNRQTSSACNQCRYADGGEYRMNKLPRVSTAKNRISSSIVAFNFTGFKNNENDWKKN